MSVTIDKPSNVVLISLSIGLSFLPTTRAVEPSISPSHFEDFLAQPAQLRVLYISLASDSEVANTFSKYP